VANEELWRLTNGNIEASTQKDMAEYMDIRKGGRKKLSKKDPPREERLVHDGGGNKYYANISILICAIAHATIYPCPNGYDVSFIFLLFFFAHLYTIDATIACSWAIKVINRNIFAFI